MTATWPRAAVQAATITDSNRCRAVILYRAVDSAGATIDFLLRAHRDYAAARRFFERAIELHGVPETITIDKSGANTAAIEGICADSGADIQLRQSK